MKRIVCYGDSNTWGHNPQDKTRFDENTRWTKLLSKRLGNEYEIIEEGLNGRNAAFIDPIKPFRHGVSSIRMVLETHQPIDLVIVMLGTNDLKANFAPNAVAISNGIKEIVQTIQNKDIYQAGYKVPEIVIVAPVHIQENYKNITRTYEQFADIGYETSKKLAYYYKEIAQQYGCRFMDASQYVQASTIDAIHMDAENHYKLSEAIFTFIK